MHVARAVIRSFAGKVGTRNASSHGHHVAHSTYNDLPSPSGNWKTHYDAMQRKYNAQLALGVAAFAGTLLFGKAAGYFEFYNDYPEKPAVIESYK
ncbi:cytochrome c oxidase subunit 7B [Rhynchophorus ferrugineus]|uniref:cytochrome c oxidase subunit 7B n=1 Tax=Rhynchophorus ferrugineus TaxID=354439 RepID=UPI003FCD9BD2